MTIPAIVKADTEQMSADELERVQWSLNGHRCDMSYIELACRVRDIYRSAYDHVGANRRAACEALNLDPADALQDNEIAVQLAAKNVEAQIGRALSPRTIFDYLGYAEKLSDTRRHWRGCITLACAIWFVWRGMDAEAQETEAESLARRNRLRPTCQTRSACPPANPKSVGDLRGHNARSTFV